MASLVGMVGCGDDDVVPPTDSGGPVDSGTRDAGTPVMMDGMVPMVDAGPGMTDGGPTDAGPGPACTNAADLAALMAAYADGGVVADGGMGSTVRTITGICGQSCATAADLPACVAMCVNMRTGNAVSMPCVSCYAQAVVCSAENCITPCSASPTGAACISCQCGMNAAMVNCISETVACTGIPSSTCAALDGGMPAGDAGPAAVDAGIRPDGSTGG